MNENEKVVALCPNGDSNRTRFFEEMRKIGRTGTEALLCDLDTIGFFSAPASSKFHGSYPGGLCEHSLNVMDEALGIYDLQLKIRPDIADVVSRESVVVAALLHDVCKADVYRKAEKFRKDKLGRYFGYEIDYSGLPMGHGEKSVIRILRIGYSLLTEEMIAIRWHMSGFDISDTPEARGNYGAAVEQTSLLGIISAADILAAQVVERK